MACGVKAQHMGIDRIGRTDRWVICVVVRRIPNWQRNIDCSCIHSRPVTGWKIYSTSLVAYAYSFNVDHGQTRTIAFSCPPFSNSNTNLHVIQSSLNFTLNDGQSSLIHSTSIYVQSLRLVSSQLERGNSVAWLSGLLLHSLQIWSQTLDYGKWTEKRVGEVDHVFCDLGIWVYDRRIRRVLWVKGRSVVLPCHIGWYTKQLGVSYIDVTMLPQMHGGMWKRCRLMDS